MDLEKVSLKQIDIDDFSYRLPTESLTDLIHLAETPILNPVWLQKKGCIRYRIIDGFRIIAAAKNNHQNIVLPAYVFPENNSPLHLWKLRLSKRKVEKNLSVYSLIEGLVLLLSAENLSKTPKEISSILIEMNLPEQKLTKTFLEKILQKTKIFSGFTDLHQLSYKDMSYLASRDSKKLIQLDQLFHDLKLKGNKLTSMIKLIDDLERGFDTTLQDILENKKIRHILAKKPVHQRYKYIKSYLLELRWPELNKLQKDWDSTLKKADLPSKIAVMVDPTFEADELQIQLTVSSIDDLQRLIVQIQQKAADLQLDHLFDFI